MFVSLLKKSVFFFFFFFFFFFLKRKNLLPCGPFFFLFRADFFFRKGLAVAECKQEVTKLICLFVKLAVHYENMPIQIYRKFRLKKKTENFEIKTDFFFHISAQNIDCG